MIDNYGFKTSRIDLKFTGAINKFPIKKIFEVCKEVLQTYPWAETIHAVFLLC